MTSPASSSNGDGSFELLDPRIQQWIWQEGWTELRDAQVDAIPVVLAADRDVIIAAATASGKTEAAFFPVLTHLLALGEQLGSVFYVSPLKALINDQWGRLTRLCERLEIPVVPWHGDISEPRKRQFLRKPSGIVLITPESVESLFVNRGHAMPALLSQLQYLVVDELHAFIGTERGKQLQSLLHRMETAVGRRLPRIGLSATLGDMTLAASYLRPGDADQVKIITSKAEGELKLIVKGYLNSPPRLDDESLEKMIEVGEKPETEDICDGGELEIAQDLFKTLRGANNLVFPNSRRTVELYSDLLRRKCEQLKVPNEFWPHHGSLSKEIREEAEAALKQGDHPSTAVCTTTLELGIDIGAVKSVAQVGCPPSVASLRQRLGRSGRRGDAAILRVHSLESKLQPDSPINDRLRTQTVQTVAMVQLLLAGWYEPPRVDGLHLSALVQQVLSLIAERGGVAALDAWRVLCETGPFHQLSQKQFTELLRGLGQKEFLVQQGDGLLLHGAVGERVVNHYDFYSAFLTSDEFRVVSGGQTLGSLPISRPLTIGAYIIFAGRRWKILTVDQVHSVVEVAPAGGGRPPSFDGGAGMVHDQVREEMRRVYMNEGLPTFLDAVALDLIAEARAEFDRLDLDSKHLVDAGKDTLIFAWKGDKVQDTLALMLRCRDLTATNEGIAVRVHGARLQEIQAVLRQLRQFCPSETVIASHAPNKYREKWDGVLPESLLDATFVASCLDLEGASDVLKSLV